ncbi:hypothetical protein PISMIDRAFT_674249 [Pisolithus microcarpus 441]|uniref:Unplaced genomic scaffold scaffold_10, whole genome shotgun sequence n=1 Tax=Pisolithus microcarpus 441 TaxID=765257 RepID=A0A0C9ZF18_9AGAM|nr:hypothetical protein PISMIDRAFT_674249 [Pisolithus microcarpus 441]
MHKRSRVFLLRKRWKSSPGKRQQIITLWTIGSHVMLLVCTARRNAPVYLPNLH